MRAKKEIQQSSETITTCPIFTVKKDRVLFPNRQTGNRFWVSHGPSVCIIPVNRQNEIILIRQYRYPTRKFLLELPAGNMDKERHPNLCAQRELAEETGFKAKKLRKIFEGYSLPGYCTEYMYFFLAQELYPCQGESDADEFIEVVPTPLAKAKKMISSGKIIDTKTALGITLAAQYLTKK